MASRFCYIILLCAIICRPSLYAQQNLRDNKTTIIKTPLLKIRYSTAELPKNAKTIVLWYRLSNQNQTQNQNHHNNNEWKLGGIFRIPEPIQFLAEKEGLYEFALTLDKNSPPVNETDNISRVLVDTAKPLLQIKDVNYSSRQAIVRWHAYDENFSDRPIEIYQIFTNAKPKFLGKFPNTGIAVIPIASAKNSRLKLIATDLADNYTAAISPIIKQSNKSIVTHKNALSQETSKNTNKSAKTPADFMQIQQIQTHNSLPTKKQKSKDIKPVSLPKPSKQAITQYEIAQNYKNKGQIDFAKMHLLEAIKLSPDFIAAKTDLAGILLSQGKYSQAENYFLQVMQVDAHNIKSLEALAKINMRRGKYALARTYLKQILENDKDNIKAMLKLGDVYWLTGDRTQSEMIWKQAKAIIEKQKLKKFEESVNSRLELIENK